MPAKSAPSLTRSQPNICLITNDFHASNSHANNKPHIHTHNTNHIEQYLAMVTTLLIMVTLLAIPLPL